VILKERKIVIVSYKFHKKNLRLQPWRYVYEIANRLPKFGWSVCVLTNRHSESIYHLNDFEIQELSHISPYSPNNLLRYLRKLSPDVILWPLGEKSVTYIPIFAKLKTRIVGYLPGPILDASDFFAAFKSKLPKECLSAALWILACKLGWGKLIKMFCDKFIVLSDENRKKMIAMGVDEKIVHVITAGCDKIPEDSNHLYHEKILTVGKRHTRIEKVALFMGWPTKVRGIELLLNAFNLATRKYNNLRLRILARGEGSNAHKKLQFLVKHHSAQKKIEVIEGFLDKKKVLSHINECDFGVLPFIQMPADRPLSFLEFFTAGKPIISTDVSGVVELIGVDRGAISKGCNPRTLAEQILKFARMSDKEFMQYRKACFLFIRNYPDWNESVSNLAKVLEN
jgi:glycosyltransferase involved in cell wall biosynthesis